MAAFDALRLAAAVVGSPVEHLLKSHGLTSAGFDVVCTLAAAEGADGSSGGLRTQQIALELVTPAPDVTRLLDRLEVAGLVERIRDEADRRIVHVRLSRAGRTLHRSLEPQVAACRAAALSALGKSEQETLAALLNKAVSGRRTRREIEGKP